MLKKLSTEELTNNLVSVLPLGVEDKQMLIETSTLTHRVRAFTAILESNSETSAFRH